MGTPQNQTGTPMSSVVVDAWDLITNGLAKEQKKGKPLLSRGRKWEVQSRTKLKSLIEGLNQYADDEDALTHFVKYSEYFLPRSDMYHTLEVLLEKISAYRKNHDVKIVRKTTQQLIGYMNWSLDAYIAILNEAKEPMAQDEAIDKMIRREFTITNHESQASATIKALKEWRNSAQ